MKSIIKKAVKNAKKDIVKKKRVVVDDDDDLINILEKCSARIKVIGAGGSGNNTLNRMVEIGIVGAKTLAVNTDAQHLVHTKADARLLLGPEITKGLGAGSNPEIGEAAARENLEELTEQLKGNDLVFITCGMGGGTGT
ncbi:MAG: cell division protein FtsZ, partial [Candidatus Diapherotrites archaeon]|nr:cell division protein FtsZ [Candidatus Diapherotrites archaeon]